MYLYLKCHYWVSCKIHFLCSYQSLWLMPLANNNLQKKTFLSAVKMTNPPLLNIALNVALLFHFTCSLTFFIYPFLLLTFSISSHQPSLLTHPSWLMFPSWQVHGLSLWVRPTARSPLSPHRSSCFHTTVSSSGTPVGLHAASLITAPRAFLELNLFCSTIYHKKAEYVLWLFRNKLRHYKNKSN